MTYILDDGERWVKSGLLGQGIEARYDIDRMTPNSHGPVIAQVLVSHVTEEARRTASARADLICSIPELIRRAEAAEARADALEDTLQKQLAIRDDLVIRVNELESERDELAQKLEQAQQTCERMNEIIKKIAKEREDIKEERDNLRLSIVNNVSA